jgi:TBC domain-containing protein kinase-like protein
MLILAFIDSDLFSHLRSLEFNPELFAIPWFLTCFAHILPFHKIFHLWDSVLLADSSFPLYNLKLTSYLLIFKYFFFSFIGVAILLHLRPQLINATFNDAILLFSDLPGKATA